MCQLFINVNGHFLGNDCEIWACPVLSYFSILSFLVSDVSSTMISFTYMAFFKMKLRVTIRCFVASQITMNAC